MQSVCPCLPPMAKHKESKVCLVIIDGWGISQEKKGNAIANARTPIMNELCKDKDRFTTLDASGLAVGLPRGLMGNSEVGHLNMGAGRVVFQDIVRINLDVENRRIDKNMEFVKACERSKLSGGRLHLLGMVSDGGVHSHMDHIYALLEAAKTNRVPSTYVQCITDGRDTSPTSSVTYLKALAAFIEEIQYGEIATVVGRYYAMDRDKRWERMKIAFDGLYKGEGELVDDSSGIFEVIEKRHGFEESERQTDEFLKPIIVKGDNRVKETEKYAHVTFFFNGGKEKTVQNEERVLVESPKVATYDLQPEMNCSGVADKMVEALARGKYAFSMCNFAPPDMVGHTGIYEAAVKAVEATDLAIGRVYEACKRNGYVLVITADHGNAEQMLDLDGLPHTAHTSNRVPLALANTKRKFCLIKHNAALCDVAPTILDLMCLDKAAEMAGVSLLEFAK